MTRSTTSYNFYHGRCAAHILNLVVKVFTESSIVNAAVINIRKVCKKIKQSPLLTQTLKAYCMANNEPGIKVQLDIDIRWNSKFEMLKTSLKMKRSLTDVSHKEKRLSPLNQNDWAVAEKLETH